MKLHDFRQQYTRGSLDESSCPADPFHLFEAWLQQAIQSHPFEANACVLSTTSGMRPSSRVVLLKEINGAGLVFFTNYQSRKAREIESNRMAAMLFYWADLERQVRIEGEVRKIEASLSDAYFNGRPAESRISAVISPQSQPIASKSWLIAEREKYTESEEKFERPDHWGGYTLMPDYFEFWQGGAFRLHDRIAYHKTDTSWVMQRLAP